MCAWEWAHEWAGVVVSGVQECMLVGVILLYGLPVRLSEGGDLFGKPYACLFGASLKFALRQ